MEKTVTLRFYDVRRTSEDRPAMADLLNEIAAKGMADRERRVTNEDILVRLENFDIDGEELHGQFIRGQTGNRPGRMMPAGTDALPFQEPLGHGIAFRYRPLDGVLAVQYDAHILSPSRILSYLYDHDARAEYRITPRLRDDAWERFLEQPTRKIEIAIAGHPDIADLDEANGSVWSNIARMKEHYGADTVRIQLTRGHRGGALTEGAKAFAREAFRRLEEGQDIRAIRGVVETGDGLPNEEIDLMGELFDVKEALSFPEDNFAQFYVLRRDLLRNKIRLL